MTVALLRVFTFTLLPVLLALIHISVDKSVESRERKLEITFLYLLGMAVVANGIGGFFGHVFLSDYVAASIGWPGGNPFQLEVGFANLATGVMGLMAMGRRDGFREATVVAVTVFGIGATIVHIMDIVDTGNLAVGNTVQNLSNLLRPVLLIWILRAIRNAEQTATPEAHAASLISWHAPRAQMAGIVSGIVAMGFGLGFGLKWPVLGTAVGALLGAGLVLAKYSRAQRLKTGT